MCGSLADKGFLARNIWAILVFVVWPFGNYKKPITCFFFYTSAIASYDPLTSLLAYAFQSSLSLFSFTLNTVVGIMTKQSTADATESNMSPILPHSAPIGIPIKNFPQNQEIDDGGSISSWIDSMKASSPTNIQGPPPPLIREKHPSALSVFEEIVNLCNGKKIVMFLDYDGTLSPIVDDPDRAFMTKAVSLTSLRLSFSLPLYLSLSCSWVLIVFSTMDLDESGGSRRRQVLSHCNCQREMQRQGRKKKTVFLLNPSPKKFLLKINY